MSEKPKHEGHRVRLRERFLAGEAASRSDEALLELLLTYSIPQRDVQPLAKTLIGRFGSLENVLAAPPADLGQTDGLKQTSIVLLKAAHEILARAVRPKTPAKPPGPPQETPRPPARVQQEVMPDILKLTEGDAAKPQASAFRAPVARTGTELFGKAVLKEAIEMLPKLPDSESLDEARQFLRRSLHFSAEGTRQRYAAYITRRMFPGGRADAALRTFARAFPNSTELRDVCFYRFCKAEPLMLKTVEDLLIPSLGLGRISRQKIKGYLAGRFPKSGSVDDATKAIVEALDAAGIVQSTRTDLQFHPRPIQPGSFAFILHSEFPEPGIYDIGKVESNPHFRALLWDPAQAVTALYECRNRGWITKVSQIDTVRQFTLRCRLEEVVALLAKEAEKR
jgi:DNA repair protein RadC